MKIFRSPTIIIALVLLISSVYVPSSTVAETGTLPTLEDGQQSPTIDGNITASEWNGSITFETTILDNNVTFQVTTNSSHLFIGFNYTTTDFNPVNNTIPAFNSTIANYTLGYNNQTHDWFAFVFDNNLDRSFGNSIGTATSPDDTIVVDQYNSSYYDGYTAGEADTVFRPDSSITYNGTVNGTITGTTLNINGTTVTGNNGTSDVSLGEFNQTDAGITSLSYEIVKPLRGTDRLGADFNIDISRILQFRLVYFDNALANATLNDATSYNDLGLSDWYSLKLNETGDGLAYQEPQNTRINVVNADDSENYDALVTVLETYGFDVNLQNTGDLVNISYEAFDFNIIILGDNEDLNNDGVNALADFIRLGGSAMVFLSPEVSGISNTFTQRMNVGYSADSLVQPSPNNETETTDGVSFGSGEINDILPVTTQTTPFTSYETSTVNLTSSVLNITELIDRPITLSQKYIYYDLLQVSDDLVVDDDNNGFISDEESDIPTANLTSAYAFDLFEGGRISVFSENSLVSDSRMVFEDNIPFILRLLPWNARMDDTLQVNNVTISENVINEGGSLTMTLNITDGYGDVVSLDRLDITVEFTLASNVIKEIIEFTLIEPGIYQGDVVMDTNTGFMRVHSIVSSDGLGFAEGEIKDILVQEVPDSPNDLTDLSIVLGVFFLISLISVVLVVIKTKNV